MELDLFKTLIKSLKTADLLKLGSILSQDLGKKFKISELDLKDKEMIDSSFYNALAHYLELKQFENFKVLLNLADKLNIHLKIEKIPKRFEILSNIHISSIRSGQIGSIFASIEFFNKYGLLKRNFTTEDLNLINKVREKKLIRENLEDLFGMASSEIIYFTFKIMLDNIFDFLSQYYRSDEYDGWHFYNKRSLMSFFNHFALYGLRIERLGHIRRFLKRFYFEEQRQRKRDPENIKKYVKVDYLGRTHLVYTNNIEKYKKKILNWRKSYKFYNVSMVLFGGLGPQGHGFAYSTPKGEVVEVCSDRVESKAIIIQYKEFLKRQFLSRLKSEMMRANIAKTPIDNIINFLEDNLDPNEKIVFFNREDILMQIKNFLKAEEASSQRDQKYEKILDKISNAITIILRPIDMVDQFKCRMDLVEEGKCEPEDVAKLTSLREKSHYDVLRERFFFQNQIEWFYDTYLDELKKFRAGRNNT